jgi:hypothetical protein
MKIKMRNSKKTFEESLWNRKDNWNPSNLDHLYSDQSLKFKSFPRSFIDIIGWPQETTKAKKKACISNYSDHVLIYGKIIK